MSQITNARKNLAMLKNRRKIQHTGKITIKFEIEKKFQEKFQNAGKNFKCPQKRIKKIGLSRKKFQRIQKKGKKSESGEKNWRI